MSEAAAPPRSTIRILGSCLGVALKVVVGLLALVGFGWLIGPCGLDTDFELNSSNEFIVAFRELDQPVAALNAQHAAGSWTLESLRNRLAEIGFEFDDEWNYLWSRVILFEPYTDDSDFHAAGVLDPAIVSALTQWSDRDGGLHLVAFDRWQPRTVMAHFFIFVEDMPARVLVIRPEDVRPPPLRRR